MLNAWRLENTVVARMRGPRFCYTVRAPRAATVTDTVPQSQRRDVTYQLIPRCVTGVGAEKRGGRRVRGDG